LGETDGNALYTKISTQMNTAMESILGAYETEKSTINNISGMLIGDKTVEEYLIENANAASTRSEAALDGVLMETESLKSAYAQLSN
jgi:hypothetical protein